MELETETTMASKCSNTLPPEMITNILCRLPAKSVGRFRCVSKDWLSQLSSHKFIKTHEITLNKKHILLNSLGELSLFSIPFEYHEKTPTNLQFRLWPIHFHGCCNGLVSGSAAFVDEDYTIRHYICNPTTKEVLGLPESGHEIIDGISKGQIVCGLGYVSLTDDYKVVTISDKRKYNSSDTAANVTMCVHVYSLRDNTWKGIIDTPANHTYAVGPGAFINGFLHWLEINENMQLGNITAFNLSDEKFNEMLLPKVDFVYGRNCKLVNIGGKLGLFLEPKGEVWLMNEYGVNGSWTKILLHGFNTIGMSFRPNIFYDNGKIMVFGQDRKFIYDAEGSFYENVEISYDLELIVWGSYVESLVSLKTHLMMQPQERLNEAHRMESIQKEACGEDQDSI